MGLAHRAGVMMTCQYCGKPITLVQTGLTHKWVTNPKKPSKSWKCGNDPAFPVRAHSPADAVDP
jgi:hypothetical protein